MHLLKRFGASFALSTSHAFCRSRYGLVRTMNTIIAEVIVKKEKTKLVEEMNPFVFSHAIKSITPSDIAMGEECLVKDFKGKVLGRGVYNSKSLYAVRMLALASEFQENTFDPLSLPISELISYRLREAKELRHSIGLPNEETSVYRLVNGEGDRLSGLVIDIFNDKIVVVQSSAAWTEKYKTDIQSSLQILFATEHIIWLPMASRLLQEQWVCPVTGLDIKTDEIVETENNIHSGKKDFRVLENGISYLVSPGNGQKTGFYCDQRDNRRLMQSLCSGKDVLDLFCNTGGFSLNALTGAGQGAKSIVAVDSSEEAVQTFMSNLDFNFKQAIENTEYNMYARNDNYAINCRNVNQKTKNNNIVNVVKADVNNFLKEMDQYNDESLPSDEVLFDVIICDPPKLAPKKTFLKKAMKRYIKINSASMRLLKPGGLLLTCSCSTVVAQETHCFTQIIREAAKEAGKSVTVLSTLSAGMDHPLHIGYSDGKHLSVVLAKVT